MKLFRLLCDTHLGLELVFEQLVFVMVQFNGQVVKKAARK